MNTRGSAKLALAAGLLVGLAACTSSSVDVRETRNSSPIATPSGATEAPGNPAAGESLERGRDVQRAYLAARAVAKRREGTVGLALRDLSTGQQWNNRDAIRRVRSASVVKLEAAAWYLLHEDGRRKRQLAPLIRMSDDQTMYDLYDPVKRDIFTLVQQYDTRARFSPWWGWTEITAQGRVRFLAELVNGNLLGPKDTRYLLNLMRDVHPSQRWGIAEPFEKAGQTALIKNGWYSWGTGLTSINCMAVVDGPKRPRQLVIAVTNSYPNSLGWEYGQRTCRLVGEALYRELYKTAD